jgi:hypothetical protein
MKYCILVIASVLTSCVASYDANEYQLINQVRTNAELSKPMCSDSEYSQENLNTIYTNSLELKNYTQYLPNNEATHELAIKLHQIVEDTLALYLTNDQVSQAFCEISLEQITESAETIQQVLGGKPR